MHIRELSLQQFRNYELFAYNFDPGIHLFIGDNAQGKTNLLEAIYVLGFAKSHRTSKDKDLISWEKQYCIIKGNVEKRNTILPLELQISVKGKKAKVNHLEQKRLSDYVGGLNVVMFAPEDLELVKGTPQIRRRFLDMEIGQISKTYLYHLSQYYHLLSQRNVLLKDWEKRKDNRPIIDVFTVQLIEVAVKIMKKRQQFMKSIHNWAIPIHDQISQGKEKLSIEYKHSSLLSDEMTENEMADVLAKQFHTIYEQEQRRGTTLIGPHRDDLIFYINDKHLQSFGSQGQQRTVALSMKLAEIDLIKEETNEYPVLLLDDVLSELDDHRRTHLLQAIQNKVQTFVTNTSVEGIDKHTLDQSTIYHINDGKIND